MLPELRGEPGGRRPPAGAPRLTYQPALDGLRGVAVAAVLVFHADLALGGELLARGGYLGVSTFFTLSGFLITSLILRERDETGTVGLARFWGRRFRRLMPAAVATLLLVALYAAAVATDPVQLARLRGDLVGALLYVANWRFVASGQSYADLFAAPSPVLHFWSLAIEEQFYLFYPLVAAGVLGLARGSRRVFAALLVGLTLASLGLMLTLYHGGTDLTRLYYGTDTRAAELLVGALLGVWYTSRYATLSDSVRRIVSVVGWLALVVTVVLYATTSLNSTWLYQGGFFVFALLTAAIIAAAVQPDGPVRAVLAWRPLRVLGLVSYGVYLYHWPIFLWLSPENTGLGTWALFPIRLAVTFALAAVSYHFLEMPIRERRLIVGRERFVAVPAALVLVLLVAVVVTLDPPDDPLAELRTEEIAAPPELMIEEPTTPEPVRVLVVGDGFATEVASGLERWGAANGELSVRNATGTACGPAMATFEVEGNEYSTCTSWVERWVSDLDTFDPDVVLVVSASWGAAELRATDIAAPAIDEPGGFTWLQRRVDGALTLLGSRGAKVSLVEFPHQLRTDGSLDVADDVLRLRAVVDKVVGDDGNTDWMATADQLPAYPGSTADPAAAADPAAVVAWADDMAMHLGPGLVVQGEAVRTQERGAKIMIVGDSVSRSLGSGLEDWASDYGNVAVWSTGTNGCGIARGGELIAALGEKPETTDCDNWGERWAAQVAEFDPDLVVVLTGVWDLTDRKLPGSDAVTWVGDPAYDAYLINEYAAAIDVLSGRGAQVAWLTAPCVGPILPGPLSDNPALDAERTNYLNAAILPGLVAARPQVEVIDLFGHVCPDGAFAGELAGIPHARPDGLHFTPASARWVADWLGLELLNRLPTDS